MERENDTDKKRVFITGASSSIMRNVISHMDRNVYELIGLSRTKQDLDNKIKWVTGDLRNIAQMENQLTGCDHIIHAAAVTHSMNNEDYTEVNLSGTQQLVDLALRLNIPRFTFISSRTAGMKSGAYGKSKALAEHYIKTNLKQWLILRPAEVFGNNPNEGIGKLLNDAATRKVMYCPAGIPSPLFPIHENDVGRIIHDLALECKKSNEIITINGSKGFSYREIIGLVNKVSGQKTRIIPIPKFVLKPTGKLLAITKIKTGIVPDQIPRLYSEKSTQTLNYPLLGLEDFIQNRYGCR